MEFRESRKSKERAKYDRAKDAKKARVADYKIKNADRNRQWSNLRHERERRLSDGSVTREALGRLRRSACECAYCGAGLYGGRVETDHIVALVFEVPKSHSMNNIVVVCSRCNGRKGILSVREWIDRIEPEHRSRLLSLWNERYGAVPLAA